MAIQNVVIIGAGGNIGSYILAGLTKAGFNVTILSRKSSKSTFPDHKVVTVSDDYPHQELVAAFKGQDAIVGTVTITPNGKVDGSGQRLFIDAAIEAGVQRYIPSEFGHDNRNEKAVELAALVSEKAKIREYLQSKQDKITWTSIFTGPFFDFDLKIGFTGIDLNTNVATLTNGGTNVFSVTTMAQIGEGVAAILKHDKETANQFVVLESFPTTQNDNTAAVEKTGRKLTFKHQTGEDVIQGSQAGIKAGSLWANYGLLQAMLFTPGYGSDMSAEGAKWREILGLKKLDLQEETERTLAEIAVQAQK